MKQGRLGIGGRKWGGSENAYLAQRPNNMISFVVVHEDWEGQRTEFADTGV